MQKISRSDIRGFPLYAQIREDLRKKVIEIKKTRRVTVGDRVTFVFENRATMIFQIEEMIRVENIRDEAAIQHEIDTYNGLLPEPGELSTTMLLEIIEKERIKPELEKLVGIQHHTFLEVDGQRVAGEFDRGQYEEGRVSAVQFVRFQLTPQMVASFAGASLALVIDHPNYQVRTPLSAETRASLAADLTAAARA
jgi:hypothetical protein